MSNLILFAYCTITQQEIKKGKFKQFRAYSDVALYFNLPSIRGFEDIF